MWPFKKKLPSSDPFSPASVFYRVIDYQVGDDVVCVDEDAHATTKQALLSVGQIYRVRQIILGKHHADGFGGPWAKLEGIFPHNDASWRGGRFKKVLKFTKKADITEQVLFPADLDVVKERELAKEIWGAK